ncbi:MAG: hypothetical protein WAM42_05545 [Candidatus Nitrosopolaris sp.]
MKKERLGIEFCHKVKTYQYVVMVVATMLRSIQNKCSSNNVGSSSNWYRKQVAVIGLHESAKAQSCASNMTNSQSQANVMPNITGSCYIRPRNIKGFALEVHVSLANLSTNAETAAVRIGFLKVGKGNQGVITAAQILLEKYRR